MIKNFFKKSYIIYIIGVIYAWVYYYGYIEFLNGYFDYAGFEIIDGRLQNDLFLLLTFSISILPLFLYRGIIKISSFLSVFIYYLLYIPIIFTFFFSLAGDVGFVILRQILFMIGMMIIFYADRFAFKKVIVFPTSFDIFKIVLFLCFAIAFYIAFVYRSNLQLVNFEEVYAQRSANQDFGNDNITGYLSVWLLNVLVPLCIVYSFFSKKKIYFIAGAFACLILYMATAAKSAVFMPIIMYGLYRLLLTKNLLRSFNIIGLALIVILLFSLMFEFNVYSSILWARTVGNGGSLTKYYYDFFQNNPNTYFSHINFINSIGDYYPYQQELGVVVGNYYWGDANANANFWATDGIAAIGDFGIIISSVLLFLVFIIFNTVADRYNMLFIILVLIPYTLSLLNTSMFSSLLSGGALIIFGILSFNSSLNNKYILK